jgi:putative component of toxin-antitoxin plasmid stabilization module
MGARGIAGRVRLLLTVIHRQDLQAVTQIVRRLHPGAFISVGDVRAAREGIFRAAPSLGHRLWNLVRKGR